LKPKLELFINPVDIEVTQQPRYVFFPDEAWFHLSGYVNSQNSFFWSSENAHLFHEVPLHSQKIGCWCAISRKWIVGPIFFSVTAEKYEEIVMQFISVLNEERFC
jgi:hypothetical protein